MPAPPSEPTSASFGSPIERAACAWAKWRLNAAVLGDFSAEELILYAAVIDVARMYGVTPPSLDVAAADPTVLPTDWYDRGRSGRLVTFSYRGQLVRAVIIEEPEPGTHYVVSAGDLNDVQVRVHRSKLCRG